MMMMQMEIATDQLRRHWTDFFHFRHFGPSKLRPKDTAVVPVEVEGHRVTNEPSILTMFKRKLHDILEDKRFHIAVIVLVSIEVLFGLTEVFFILYYDTKCPRIEEPSAVMNARDIMPWIAYSILLLFVVEILLKLFCYGYKFFTHTGNIIDFIVVFVSFSFDTFALSSTSRRMADGSLEQISSFIVILRLWRVLRIVHGMMEELEIVSHDKQIRMEREILRLREQLLAQQQSQSHNSPLQQ